MAPPEPDGEASYDRPSHSTGRLDHPEDRHRDQEYI